MGSECTHAWRDESVASYVLESSGRVGSVRAGSGRVGPRPGPDSLCGEWEMRGCVGGVWRAVAVAAVAAGAAAAAVARERGGGREGARRERTRAELGVSVA